MSILLFSILALIAGLGILIYQFLKKQVELGFAATFMATGLSLVVSSFGTFSERVISALLNAENSVNTMQFITGVVLIFVGIWMSLYVTNKLTILNLLGVKERRIEEHRSDVKLNQFEFKEREVDLSIYPKKEMNKERFQDAKESIELALHSFHAETKNVKKGYTGTAPIPLTAYAGYCYKGAPTTEFFEYNISLNKFEKLKKSREWVLNNHWPKLNRIQLHSELIEQSQDVVIGISTSYKIQDHHVKQFKAPFVHLTTDKPQPNSIKYEAQLKAYVEEIQNLLFELGQRENIKRIHLVMSSQSCLAFELGKKFTTNTYMKQLTVYHFKTNQEPVYPWGITFNNEGVFFVDCKNVEVGEYDQTYV
ncbi:SAVED domain-containing protein [Alkalihalophilus pseudofirmus]|uniref:SAVED domain-containing protein n=1 Tax=Alkalihalophilus pseudofirmus TaxID=79885 RepID=A0AAJ2L1A4_ALKPS|nr:SAVED domain-containing protein [Alkalihalophilus pseudofirmus]MDV2884805.1 SAVED domain-containing protein [Alkalihalophilus pseudofirmus]